MLKRKLSASVGSSSSNWETHLCPGRGIPYYVLREESIFQGTDAQPTRPIVIQYTTMSREFVDLDCLPFFKQKTEIPLTRFLGQYVNEATVPATGNDNKRTFSIVVLFQSEEPLPTFLYYIFDSQTLKLHFLHNLRLSEHYFMKDVPIWAWQQEAVRRAYRLSVLTTTLQRLFWNRKHTEVWDLAAFELLSHIGCTIKDNGGTSPRPSPLLKNGRRYFHVDYTSPFCSNLNYDSSSDALRSTDEAKRTVDDGQRMLDGLQTILAYYRSADELIQKAEHVFVIGQHGPFNTLSYHFTDYCSRKSDDWSTFQ